MRYSFLDSLRGGGYVFYIRHAKADVGEDQQELNFQDCSTQRNLSELGISQAVYFRQILDYYLIPISFPIETSPLCRAIETAQAAFGNVPIEVNPYWYDVSRLEKLTGEEQNIILSYLPANLEIMPPPGSNRMIIAHSFPEGMGLGKLSDLETVIIRPLGQGNGYEIVNKLSLTDLANLD